MGKVQNEIFSKVIVTNNVVRKYFKLDEKLVNQKYRRFSMNKEKLNNHNLILSKPEAHQGIEFIISKMGTVFATPEESIISQDDTPIDMYFIQQGDCLANQNDHFGNTYNLRLLIEGDYFGEVGCLYKTKRTCSVVCRYYNTLARITISHFQNIMIQFPKLSDEFEKNLFQDYKDPMKRFFNRTLK